MGTVIALPVFDCFVRSGSAPTGPPPTTSGACTDGGGSKTWDHIAGWAKFYLSGYDLPGLKHKSVLPGGLKSCPGGGSSKCIFGWFLKGTLDDATSIVAPGGTNDFGTYQVLPAG